MNTEFMHRTFPTTLRDSEACGLRVLDPHDQVPDFCTAHVALRGLTCHPSPHLVSGYADLAHSGVSATQGFLDFPLQTIHSSSDLEEPVSLDSESPECRGEKMVSPAHLDFPFNSTPFS